MAILGGKITSGESHMSPNINLFHLFVVAPWLYYLSTNPADWQQYLKLTALAVAGWHGYRAFTKMNHTEKQMQKGGDQTVLSMMF